MRNKQAPLYHQQSFLEAVSDQIVNVASVPQRSPFRYPGGKTWLVPRIRLWLAHKAVKPALLIDPFAGGGIVSLTVAAERLAGHVIMVELDEAVAAVWQTILMDDREGEWLAEKIASFDLKPMTVQTILSEPAILTRDLAFQTILKNRVNRGGIMAPGAGLIKAGEAGKGLLSRWYPETLRSRILDIVEIRDRITFIHDDGIKLIQQYKSSDDVAFFIDPPYTASKKRAGSRLYKHSDIDHEALFHHAASLSGDFLMTYDDSEEVRALANQYGFDVEMVAMKNTHHAQMSELLISRNLDWLHG